MTRAEMLEKMDIQELKEWQLFAILEPFGSLIDDHRFGTVASSMFHAMLGKKAKAQPSDFFKRTTMEQIYGDVHIEKKVVKRSWQQLMVVARQIHNNLTKKGSK